MKFKRIDLRTELDFITSLITSTEVCKAVIPFDVSLLKMKWSRIVAEWCTEYFQKYRQAIGKNIHRKFEEEHIVDSDEPDLLEKFLSNLSKVFESSDPECEKYSIEKAYEYLRNRTQAVLIEELIIADKSGEDVNDIIANFKPYITTSLLPEMESAETLKVKELPKQKRLVPNLFGWGLIMFAGTHKIGKSFMMLQLAADIATGKRFLGFYRTKPLSVLYLCLEDSESRIQSRIKQLGIQDRDLSKLHLMYEIKRGTEGLADLSYILETSPEVKLIIIDALASFRSFPKSRNIFQSDYDTLREIKTWANKHDVCVIVVHHTRKPGANSIGPIDIVDTVNGSSGLAAAVDQTFIMSRARKSPDAKLYTTSRDMKEEDIAIHFDLVNGGWTFNCEASEFDLTPERRAILKLLQDNGSMLTGGIAHELGKTGPTISLTLKKMVADGIVKKEKYGEYTSL
jgi:DNA-binding transcriptional ArsR family regulator